MFLLDNINIFIKIYILSIVKSLLSIKIYIILLIFIIYINSIFFSICAAKSVVLVDLVSFSNFFV